MRFTRFADMQDDSFNEDVMYARENTQNVSDQIDYYEDLILNDNDKEDCKCPTCGSTNIKKISTANRIVSTGLFGLASRHYAICSANKIGKQWHCNNCNSDF